MDKKLIRLTESDLHRIVKQSVKKILSEGGNVGRGRFTIYPRSNSVKIVDNQLGTSYLYDFRSNSWDRNATPDFGSANISAEELQRAGVQNPQALLNSINQIEGARQQQMAQQRPQQRPQQQRPQQRPQQQSYDDKLKEYAKLIKNGYQANYATERDLDRMLRMGLVTPRDINFVYNKEGYYQGDNGGSVMPRFY